jgi:hypothetical protein
LGVLRIIIDVPIFDYFRTIGLFGFFLLFFIEIPIPVFLQSIFQGIGIIYIYISNGFKLPSKENYVCKCDYILPFTGKWTVVNGGFNKQLSHSWGILSQRYAYDFLILDDEGKFCTGDNKSVQNYFCYGKDIIAPANGKIVEIGRKQKDSYVDGKNGYCDAFDLRGNYIVIKHNDCEYSLIAHIMPDSITVNVGDEVKQGEVIAKCGNTGNTSQPHIHFQLQSGKNHFTSATLPIIFTNIQAKTKINYELLDKRPCPDNLETLGNKSYIGRGLEVENI